ncbi:MAG: helix-turn-helix domain-containing protein [Pseudonocardiaceae bacterium]
MNDLEPAVRTRELGEGLRQDMEKVGLTSKQVAHLLGWPQSQVSRLLSGKRKASPLQVTALLAVCRATGAERERLLALCQEQHTPGWLQQHGSPVARTAPHPDQPREQGGRDQ